MKYKNLGLIAATGVLVLSAQQSHAVSTTAKLRLSDLTVLGSEITIDDNGAGDSNPMIGAVAYIGLVGNFNVIISAGATAPVLPGPYPHLDLVSLEAIIGSGTLAIGFTDIDQTAQQAAMTSTVGGTLSGGVTGVTFATYVDSSNAPFGTGSLINQFSFNTPAFSGSGTTAISAGQNYSASVFATITATGAGVASFDLELKPAPDAGSSALMLGCGVTGLVAFARRKK